MKKWTNFNVTFTGWHTKKNGPFTKFNHRVESESLRSSIFMSSVVDLLYRCINCLTIEQVLL